MPSDNFNRANGSLGADWTTLTGTWAIVSNQAEVNDDGGPVGYIARFDGAGADVGSSDMYTQAVTNSTQTNAGSNASVAVRHRSGATTGYQFTTNLLDNCALWRVNAGVETQIATFTTPIAAGDTIRLEAVGRTFRFKVNGAIRNLLQNTNITDGQRGALNGYNGVGTDVVRLDDFVTGPMTDLVSPYLVDWSAQTARSVAASLTPDMVVTPQAGDLVIAHGVIRSVTETLSPPAGEGWTLIQLASGNSLRAYVWAKIWGLGGQTDDTTPTFTRTGTTGAFMALSLWRNPKHATSPWTSVASAVVASGEQSNAAAATATCPSVNYVGNNLTVVRLASSADDNALNAPSQGFLLYGGAAYDATDIAQACSFIEDQTLVANTGTSTFAESVNGNDASNGVTLVLAIPSAAPVGALAEVDALLGVSKSSQQTAGVLAEVDALANAQRSSSQVVAGIGEGDALLPASHTTSRLVGALAEADSLLAVQRSSSKAVTVLAEVDALLSAGRTSAKTVSALAEVDALLQVARASAQTVGLLAELDVLLPAGSLGVVGALSEVDTLLPAERLTAQLVLSLSEVDALLPATGGSTPESGVLVRSGGQWRPATLLVAAGNSWVPAGLGD